jgi:hypothetical protein
MTPVGSSKCPYCDQEIPASELPFGSMECPECAQRVWFLTLSGERTYFRYQAAALVQRLFESLMAEQRVPKEVELDEMDLIELVTSFRCELEDAQ